MTPASLRELMQAASPVIEQEWLGASDPLSSAAKDHQSFLALVEKSCRWVLVCSTTSDFRIMLRFPAVHQSVEELQSDHLAAIQCAGGACTKAQMLMSLQEYQFYRSERRHTCGYGDSRRADRAPDTACGRRSAVRAEHQTVAVITGEWGYQCHQVLPHRLRQTSFVAVRRFPASRRLQGNVCIQVPAASPPEPAAQKWTARNGLVTLGR
jgi:hypothetical protein